MISMNFYGLVTPNHGRLQRGAGGRAPLDFHTWYR